jgi:HK97 gp10 family phage protein
MARPNNAGAIAAHITGLRELKAKFEALPAIVREHMNEANEITAREIQIRARRQLEASPSIRTRSLWNAVQYRVTKSNGTAKVGIARATTTFVSAGVKVRIKGIVKADPNSTKGWTKVQPARYAHLVEWGSVHMSAEPFMTPAMEAERAPYVARCKAARAPIVRDLQAVGSAGVALGGLI